MTEEGLTLKKFEFNEKEGVLCDRQEIGGMKMNKKVIAIVGSYRKGGITDQTVDAILKAVQQKGGQVEKISLTEKRIEFCTNCRKCAADDPEKRRGKCIFNDDMEEILSKIDEASGLVFASPVNFGNITAIMKRFIERLIVYAYWPWTGKFPKRRIKERDKKAILVTSSAAPAFIGRVLMPCALKTMKEPVGLAGAKVIKTIYSGLVCIEEKQKLNKKQLKSAESAGASLFT